MFLVVKILSLVLILHIQLSQGPCIESVHIQHIAWGWASTWIPEFTSGSTEHNIVILSLVKLI